MYVDSVTLGLTNNCNLNCTYCFEGVKNRGVMPPDVAKRAVDWVFRDDVSGPANSVDISFFGGEPLLQFDTIKTVVPYARKRAAQLGKSVTFGITTNGTLFKRDVAKFWIDNDLGVLLSCDGTRTAHDASRKTRKGGGSYRMLEKNMEHILAASKNRDVRMTVTQQTSRYIADGVRHLSGLGFESIAVFHTEEGGWSETELLEHEKGFFEIGDFLVEKIEQGADIRINPLEGRIKALLSGEKSLENGCCGAGRNYLGIGVDGTLYPCHRFVTAESFKGAFPIGNIKKGIEENRRMPFIRLKKKLLLGCDMECEECDLLGICSGGCLAANYTVTGQIAQRPPESRLHETIWCEVAQSIVDYFDENRCDYFEKRYGQNTGIDTDKNMAKITE